MSGRKPRLLIADDSGMVRQQFSDIFKDQYELVEAKDGETAWSMVSSDQGINMVFADASLPNLDGLGLLKRIRSTEDQNLKSLPVIMLTEAGYTSDKAKASLVAGVTDLVRKPLNPDLLKTRALKNLKSTDTEEPDATCITATVDPLTQLANEPYFLMRGAMEASFANRHKADFALVLVRIDNFLELEREHDRFIIDSMLVKVGKYINSFVRKEDTLARIDKDTFGLLLVATDTMGALETAERIRQKIRHKVICYDDKSFLATVSIGVSAPPAATKRSFDLMLSEANAELNKAAEVGGDCLSADAVHERLVTNTQENNYLPGLDEALEMLGKNQSVLLNEQVNALFVKLLPLLMFCDKKLELGLVEELNKKKGQLVK